jgi:hypothetical protein
LACPPQKATVGQLRFVSQDRVPRGYDLAGGSLALYILFASTDRLMALVAMAAITLAVVTTAIVALPIVALAIVALPMIALAMIALAVSFLA